jgi:type VI secretion system protein ImpM
MPRAALSTRPGFHGKLPAHGDFVGRGLPRAFLDPFVAWLDTTVRDLEAQLGPRWADPWANDGAWRFALAPGIAGAEAVAGVLAAGVDRGGRAYPLVIAACVGDAARPASLAVTGNGWTDAAAALARRARDERLNEAALDRAMAVLGLPPLPPSAASGTDDGGALHARAAPGRPALAALPRLLDLLCDAEGKATSLWWRDESLSFCSGLPEADKFAALIDGRFKARGWVGDA